MGSTAQPARQTASGAIISSLEDMTIFLFEAGRLARCGATRRRRRRSRSRSRRPDFLDRRNARVGAAKQEQVRFVRLLDTIRRRPEAAGTHRANQARRHNHEQLSLFTLEARRAEQRADDRQRAEDRELPDSVLEVLPEKTSERETLPVPQLDGRLGAASLQTRDRQIVDDDRGTRIDRADFRRDDEVDDSIGKHCRGKGQADAERLPFNGQRGGHAATTTATDILCNRHRELAAGKEAGGLTGKRDQSRLRERVNKAFALQRIERRVNLEPEDVEGAGQDAEAVDDRAQRKRWRALRSHGARAAARKRNNRLDHASRSKARPAADCATEAVVAASRDEPAKPELLQRRALDLGEADLEHDLLRGPDRKH